MTPNEELKLKQKGKSQNRVTLESSKVKKDTREQTKPKPVAKIINIHLMKCMLTISMK